MFITFEGIDGCGKTTQINMLRDYLLSNGSDVLSIREPGGTTFSETIRDILLNSKEDISDISELMLFESARADLVEKVISPALVKGQVVISDRFFDSTTAYQGYGRGIDIDSVTRLNMTATGGLEPDITFYLRIPLEISANRLNNIRKDRMESSGREFYERVITGFDILAQNHPKRVITINGTAAIGDIHKQIIEHIEAALYK